MPGVEAKCWKVARATEKIHVKCTATVNIANSNCTRPKSRCNRTPSAYFHGNRFKVLQSEYPNRWIDLCWCKHNMKSDSDLIRCWLLVQSNKQVFSIKRVGLFQFISPLSVDEIAADENLNDDQLRYFKLRPFYTKICFPVPDALRVHN